MKGQERYKSFVETIKQMSYDDLELIAKMTALEIQDKDILDFFPHLQQEDNKETKDI